MILQDSLTSLNPAFTIGDQVGEAIALHQGGRGRELAPTRRRSAAAGTNPRRGEPSPRLPARAERWDAAARGRGDRARLHAVAAHRRRADDRAGHDGPGAVSSAPEGRAARVADEHDFRDPRLRRRREDVRSRRRHVRRQGGRDGHDREIFDNPRHPYTRALLRCLPRVDGPRAGPGQHRRPAPRPGRGPARLSVRTAMLDGRRGMPRISGRAIRSAMHHRVSCWRAARDRKRDRPRGHALHRSHEDGDVEECPADGNRPRHRCRRPQTC